MVVSEHHSDENNAASVAGAKRLFGLSHAKVSRARRKKNHEETVCWGYGDEVVF